MIFTEPELNVCILLNLNLLYVTSLSVLYVVLDLGPKSQTFKQ